MGTDKGTLSVPFFYLFLLEGMAALHPPHFPIGITLTSVLDALERLSSGALWIDPSQ